MTPGDATARRGSGPPAAHRKTSKHPHVNPHGGWSERPWKGISFLVTQPAGLTINSAGVARLPYRLPDGSVFRERFFAPDGRAWWAAGGGLVPFGLETLPPAAAAASCGLLIAEGESDALALREAFAGVAEPGSVHRFAAIALPGAATWRPEWRAHLEPHRLIYLVGDGDAAGRRMAESVLRDIPWARPLRLPDGEDARAMLQRHGRRALDRYLAEADRDALIAAAFQRPTLDAAIAFLRGEEELRRVA